jgi:hypothetical protein
MKPCRYDRNRYRKENKAIAQEYKELLRISYQTLSEEDKKLIRKAFDVSVEAHKEQRRIRRPIFSILLLWQNSRFRNRLGCDFDCRRIIT